MENIVTVEKLTGLVIVVVKNANDVSEAMGYYERLFSATVTDIKELKGAGGQIISRWVELTIANARIVICMADAVGDDARVTSGSTVEVVTVDVNSSLEAFKKAGGVEVGNISQVEACRGVKAKVRDPYGFIWSLAEKMERPSSTLPLLFPALESEVTWWMYHHPIGNTVRRQWIDNLNHEQQYNLLRCETSMDALEKSLLNVKHRKYFYQKTNFHAFQSHPSLSEILLELERINGILQGVQLVFFLNPLIRGHAQVREFNKKLKEKYDLLWSGLPSFDSHPSQWSGLIAERERAACYVRQLLKSLESRRYKLNRDGKANYRSSVLNEELVMNRMMWEEVQTNWRAQDRTE
ncbi:unnamed protein product [Arabidopsis lyrata]|uniref:uncharacterized protein LOC9313718 n=1 Tax=Arabidopsis lyrata subsp. lyrata TaxID=81972 RepID=UPI000A29D3DC|nr:uncharacterized protein LOC9313718 [Arabidopsis lyrata subsp. lyrata]XP_020881668.1 uncharacterized protein LOC9313718 [Arabidopsis lyrata subsp. lyrata]CAH8267967.1 unnamed protein product [Arabidopsis lyrata]|eukprot:XP_020881667.1 uncharacterized protein LOC9313718 [Arabidopsis lyrata subsp. lyrata]